MIIPKTKKEAEELVFDVFLQGDMRHFDSFYLNLVSDFIMNKAITIKKEVFSFKGRPKIDGIPEPQKCEKANALEILKLKISNSRALKCPF